MPEKERRLPLLLLHQRRHGKAQGSDKKNGQEIKQENKIYRHFKSFAL